MRDPRGQKFKITGKLKGSLTYGLDKLQLTFTGMFSSVFKAPHAIFVAIE